ncbi:unnamed protein product [Boreogadus saida]
MIHRKVSALPKCFSGYLLIILDRRAAAPTGLLLENRSEDPTQNHLSPSTQTGSAPDTGRYTTQEPEMERRRTTQEPEMERRHTTQEPEMERRRTTQEPEMERRHTTQEPEMERRRTTQEPEMERRHTTQEPEMEKSEESTTTCCHVHHHTSFVLRVASADSSPEFPQNS